MSHTQTHSSRTKTPHRLDAHAFGDAVSGVQDSIVQGAQGLGDALKSTIKERPLQSVGVALGVGVLISLLMRKH